MTDVLQVGDRRVTAEELVPLLASYQMLPQLLRELLIDGALADWEKSGEAFAPSTEEVTAARQAFYQQRQLTSGELQQAWLARHHLVAEQLDVIVTRSLKLEKYKQATWGPRVDSYFLQRKSQLNKVIYSLLRVKDPGVAQELYFRIQEGEQSFADLARQYSEGPEAQTGGLVGPVDMATPHPSLARILATAQPGAVNPPARLGEWIVIVRLEKQIPAQLDDVVRRQLIEELFNTWLQEQLQQVRDIVPAAVVHSA